MKLLILGFFLAVSQTAPPVSPQAADSSASTAHKGKQNSTKNKNQSIQPQTPGKPITSNAQENPTNGQQIKDPYTYVKVRELPPVSVAKDWADWGIWAFSGLLVVVGILQWYVIRTQANLMRKHAEHLKNLANAANTNALAAKNSAEAAKVTADAFITESRPWLLLHKNMSPDNPHTRWEFEFRIQNFGKTPAKVVACQLELQVGDKDGPPSPGFFESERPFPSMILPQGEFLHRPFSATATRFSKAHTGEKYVWFCGLVRYQDVFESATPISHETFLCFRCEPSGTKPMWARGPDEYNRAT